MSPNLILFLTLVDALREARRVSGHDASDDRPLLDQLAELVDAMDEKDQDYANGEGWRGWPDLFDARMKFRVETVDPDDAERAGDPPRKFSEAA